MSEVATKAGDIVPAVPTTVEAALNKDGKKTYGQIIKSSALIGGSTMINVGLSMVRTKVLALLLGTSGMGLFGDFGTISDLVRTVAGMGINFSGVRQIAEAVGTGEQDRIARTVTALRRVALATGALGALILLIFCRQFSWMMFKDYAHAPDVALLALVVFFADVSAGQGALIQGMRRIGDLARMSVWGALFGTVFSIPIIYVWRERGVVPSLVCAAAMTILTSWWYARKIKVPRVGLTWREMKTETSGLLQMGVVFMASGFMTMGMAFLVRAIITRKIGLEASGLYQSAWVLGGVYMTYILQAMGADFFPRLTAVAKDNEECNRLVNEQVEIGLLVGGPGVLATLAFAPLVIQLFYSSKFGPAEDLLRWICMGMLLRVTSWPMGYFFVAKGARKIFFWSELGSNLAYVSLIWIFVQEFKLTGAGIAFFGSYVLYTFAVYLIMRRLSGFRWSTANLRVAALIGPLMAMVFVSQKFLPPLAAGIFGAAVTVFAGILSMRTLCTLVPLKKFPRLAQKLLVLFRMAPLDTSA
jgi:PST family polysaccharide transporter